MVAAKTFQEWYAFRGGEEMNVSRDDAATIWKAAIKSLEGVRERAPNSQSVAALNALDQWVESAACYLPDSELDTLRPIIQRLNAANNAALHT